MRTYYNRPTHYNVKYTKNQTSPMFFIKPENMNFLKFLAEYEQISLSRALNLAIYHYKIKLKGGQNAYKRARYKVLKRRKKRVKILRKKH